MSDYLKLLSGFNRWLENGGQYGNWRPDQADGRGAKGYTGITIEGIPVEIYPAAEDSWAIRRAGFATGESPGLITPKTSFADIHPINIWGQQITFTGFTVIPCPTQTEPEIKISQCQTCRAAHRSEEKHDCPTPSQVDLDAVSTIQKLAAGGLSAPEIAADMGIVMAWRLWSVGDNGLAGWAAGEDVTWPIDRPIMSVCINQNCALKPKLRKECASDGRPPCRIHAMKKSAQLYDAIDWDGGGILGAVGLWGEVIECEDGYLATRAYPIGFTHEVWVRAYRVAKLKDEGALAS